MASNEFDDFIFDLDVEFEENDDTSVPVTGEKRPVEDTYEFVANKRNYNTVRKTKYDMNIVIKYLNSENDLREIETIPPVELNTILAKMFMTLKKDDGSDYEPSTVLSIKNSVFRYLSQHNYECNIITDERFKHSRDVLHAKMKELKQRGLGNKQHRSEAYTPEEINILWDKKLLGTANPTSLQNSMFFNNTLFLGMRGRQEHTNLLWGDLVLKTTATGREYVEFNERITKTRDGSSGCRPFAPKMFAEDHARCPVKMYKAYAKQRPQVTLNPDSRFYLQINNSESRRLWYKNQPLGRDSIGNISKRMAEAAGISGKKTNHGVRKTAIQCLTHAAVPPTHTMQLSGHKNVCSINEYGTLSMDQQSHLSSTLSDLQRAPVKATAVSGRSSASCTVVNNGSQNAGCSGDNFTSEISQSYDDMPVLTQQVTTSVDMPIQVNENSVTIKPVRNVFDMPLSISFAGATIQSVVIYNKGDNGDYK